MRIKLTFFALILAILQACSWTQSSEPITTSFDTRILEEQAVKEIRSQQQIQFTGVVRINENKLYHYRAPQEAVIEQIHFNLGDVILKGSPLLTLQSPAYNALGKELKALQADLMLQERSLESAKSLYEDGLLAEQAYLTAQAELKNIQAQVNQVKNTLELYGQPISDKLFQINAKQNGVVVRKEVSPYLAVAKDETLVQVADLSTVWIQIAIHPTQMPYIQEGDQVSIRSAAYPTELFKGQVFRISPTLDETTKVLQAFIQVPNPDNKLKPSLAVEVELNLDQEQKQIAIPTEALIFDSNQHQVVLRQGSSYRIHPVQAAHEYQSYTFIKEGLQVNDTIVTKNNLLIYNYLKSIK